MSATLVSADGGLRYEDTPDHLENGLLRLLNLSQAELQRWLDLAARSDAGDLLARLRDAWTALRPPPPAPAGPAADVGPGPDGLRGRVLHAAIAESPGHGVAISDAARHGWLVRWDGRRFARETQPPSYEEEYFEGDKLTAGGYGDYSSQAGWRLEKAARQVGELRAATGIGGGRVLDIGSGYGFFRVALGDAGYEHDGLEISRFARAAALREYGLQTHPGTLAEHCGAWRERYDVVTLFDLIEHLSDPVGFLRQVAAILRPGGAVGIKTPNLCCPEARLFGAHYHSFKREHLGFFSAPSLTAAAHAAGLEPLAMTTSSHLLVGFVGPEQTRAWEEQLQGADLLAWFRLR
jgi:2-polyprenyl-3-methyl-5-hydroxy-6-metoxy-1,4-benzoquinol methylase